MIKQSYFKSKIGKITISGIMCVGSFPILYASGQTQNSVLISIGLIMLFSGMISVPIMNFLDKD